MIHHLSKVLDMKKISSLLITILTSIALIGWTSTSSNAPGSPKQLKLRASTDGMSKQEYQSLIFLDPQNTVMADYHAVKGMDGHFLIDNQGEPTVSVVDYNKGETIKKIQMKDPAGTNFKPGGNHHIFIIPGARYAWSSQRYEKDVFWTIDLTTQ